MSSNVSNAFNGMLRGSRSARADGHERGASSLLQLATTADKDDGSDGAGAGAGAGAAADTAGKHVQAGSQPQSQSQPGVNDDEHQIMQILANVSFQAISGLQTFCIRQIGHDGHGEVYTGMHKHVWPACMHAIVCNCVHCLAAPIQPRLQRPPHVISSSLTCSGTKHVTAFDGPRTGQIDRMR